MYVTDNFQRYCVHMNQVHGGRRQIILSSLDKKNFEEWLSVFKHFIDLEHSMVFRSRPKSENSISASIPTPNSPGHLLGEPVMFGSSPSNSNYDPSRVGERVFTEEVSDEFIDTVKTRYPIYLDPTSARVTISQEEEMYNPAEYMCSPPENSPKVENYIPNPDTPWLGTQSSQAPSEMDFSIFERASPPNRLMSMPPIPAEARSSVPPSPFNVPTRPTSNSSDFDFSSLRVTPQSTPYKAPSTENTSALLSFQAKFQLPSNERPHAC